MYLMKRQDPAFLARETRDAKVRRALAQGQAVNRSRITALSICACEDCAHGAADLAKVLKREIKRQGYELPVVEAKTVCSGECGQGPFIGLVGRDMFYAGLKPSEVPEALFETLYNGNIFFRRAHIDPLKATDAGIVFDWRDGMMVALDPEADMVEWARYLFEFNMEESCGKCTPCRAGCTQVAGFFEKLMAGKASEADLSRTEDLLWLMDQGAFCRFAPKVAKGVSLALANFRAEFEERLAG